MLKILEYLHFVSELADSQFFTKLLEDWQTDRQRERGWVKEREREKRPTVTEKRSLFEFFVKNIKLRFNFMFFISPKKILFQNNLDTPILIFFWHDKCKFLRFSSSPINFHTILNFFLWYHSPLFRKNWIWFKYNSLKSKILNWWILFAPVKQKAAFFLLFFNGNSLYILRILWTIQ